MRNSTVIAIFLLMTGILLRGEVYDLKKAISTALANNETVQSAEKELEKSEYVYNEAFSGALPKVEANLTYLRNLYSSKITNMEYYLSAMSNGIAGLNNTILDYHPDSGLSEMTFVEMPDEDTEAMSDNTIKAELSLIQPIWLGGKVGTALDIAEIFKDLNTKAYELEKNKVVTEIKKNFYQILVLKETQRVMNLVRSDAYKNLEKVEKLFAEGLVSEYDMIQARVRVKSIEPKITSVNNYLGLAKEYMRFNMGLPGEEDFDVSGELTETAYPDTANIDSKALENRAELQLLEYQRQLYEKNVTIEFSNHLPNILGLANYTFQSQTDDLGDTFEKNCGVGTFNVGVTANIPIFNGFGTKAKVDQAKVEEKKAALNVKKTSRLIKLQVRDALSKLNLAREELVLRDNEISEYEKALQITQVRYDNGLCTQLELTGAQTSLETARLNKVTTLQNYIGAMIDLEAAVGVISTDEFKN